MMKEPAASAVAVRFTPVSVCVAVSSTPGITAPDESFTVPLMRETACPYTHKQANKPAARIFMPIPFLSTLKIVREALQRSVSKCNERTRAQKVKLC